MNLRLAWIQFRMFTIPTGLKRTRYLRKTGIFGHLGRRVMIQSRKLPLYPELIFIGDNVRIATGVHFITHDAIHHMLAHLPEAKKNGWSFKEKKGKIVIGDNVFIGSNSTVLYDCTIGSNVIVGTGSVVTKDLPGGTVCAGVPCRVVGDFDSFMAKRKEMTP